MNLHIRLALAAAAAVVLAGALVVSSSEGFGPYNVNGKVTQLLIHYPGYCGTGGPPLTLTTSMGIGGQGTALPPYMPVAGSVRYCLATQAAPGALLIDGELFGYANVAAATATTPDISPSYTGLVTVVNLEGQPDFPADFLGVTQVFIGDELVNVASVTSTSIGFTITGRAQAGGQTPAVAHPYGSLVRAEGRLKLVSRGQPRYACGCLVAPPESLTRQDPHISGAAVKSPEHYLSCRSRMEQTPVPTGNDNVTARTRCYAMLQTSPTATYWPDPYPGPVLPLNAGVYHDILTGTINDTATGVGVPLTLTFTNGQFGVAACNPYITNLQGNAVLWVKITLTTTVLKGSSLTGSGLFRVSVYTDAACSALLTTPLGTGSNLASTEISAGFDSDGDGCSDYKELAGGPYAEATGGNRDPFNKWDFYDANGDKVIDLFTDIFGVAFLFGADADNIPPGEPDGYVAALDRGPPVGPGAWNMSGPDGNIDLFTDIFGVAFQFGHDCN